jgi:uncharacterized protein
MNNPPVSEAGRAMLAYIDAFRQADMPALFRLFADDATVEFPYAPQGLPNRLDGIDAIRAYYIDAPKTFRFDRYLDIVMHPSSDPDRIVAEFKCEAMILTTGKPYNQTYISTLRVGAGRITDYKEFWNPIIVLDVLGGRDRMQVAFNAQ